MNGKRRNPCTLTNTCCAACCMCDRAGVHRKTKLKKCQGERGKKEEEKKEEEEDEEEERQERNKETTTKKEKRRLQRACREHHKNGEPNAPTQRRPTSMNTADWSAKLREKARKGHKAGSNSSGHFNRREARMRNSKVVRQANYQHRE